MLCDTAGVGVLLQPLPTGSPFGHHPRLSMGCPRWGQWMSAQEEIPLTSTRANRIWSCRYSHSSHRLPPSPRIVYSLADTLTHRIAYHRHHVSYIVLQILSTHCIAYHRLRIPYMVLQIFSLTTSPNSVPAYRIWSCGYSHPTPLSLSHLYSRTHTEPPPEEAHHA